MPRLNYFYNVIRLNSPILAYQAKLRRKIEETASFLCLIMLIDIPVCTCSGMQRQSNRSEPPIEQYVEHMVFQIYGGAFTREERKKEENTSTSEYTHQCDSRTNRVYQHPKEHLRLM